MKGNHNGKRSTNIFSLTAMMLLGLALLVPCAAMAADNVGTGDIAGDSASLNSSNTFSLFTTVMSLNKMAFLTNNGTQLTSGATLPRGTEVSFVIYIDNTTAFGLSDVSVQDVLDPTFAYQADSMLVIDTIPTGSSQAVIYSTVSTSGAAATDVINDDVASAVGVTINVGNSAVPGNTALDVPASSVWAILFRALMQ